MRIHCKWSEQKIAGGNMEAAQGNSLDGAILNSISIYSSYPHRAIMGRMRITSKMTPFSFSSMKWVSEQKKEACFISFQLTLSNEFLVEQQLGLVERVGEKLKIELLDFSVDTGNHGPDWGRARRLDNAAHIHLSSFHSFIAIVSTNIDRTTSEFVF